MVTARMLSRLVVGATALAFSLTGFAHSGSHSDSGSKQIYRFKITDFRKDMQAVNALGFDVAGVNLKKNVIDLVLDSKELTAVRMNGGLKLINQVNDGLNDLDDQYHTGAEVEAELNDYAARYPEIAMVKSIGKSTDGRDIWAIKISDNVAQDEKEEPAILFNGMHHAREVMTVEVTMDTVNYLLTRYADDPKVKGWVNNNQIWIVPMFNVDGNNKVWNGSSMWRKNTRGGYGVDLNRNYPYAWGSCNGSSGSTFSDTYRGPSAGSEPETKAMMNLVKEIRPVFDISYHSYSELVIYPYGCEGQRTATQEVVESVGKKMASLLPSDEDGTYTPGTSWETLYSVDGGDIDWMYGTYGVIPYVIEVNSTGEGFQPSYSTWRNKTVEKLRSAWQMILNRTEESGIRGIVELNSGRLAENVQAKIECITNPQLASRVSVLKADGSFHAVLNPGTYTVTISDGQNTLPPETIEVGERVSTVRFDF